MKPFRFSLIGVAVAAMAAIAGPTAAQSNAKYPMKVAHLESPTQPRHQAFLKVAELVRARTNGEVEMQLFPAAQLGNARQIMEGVQFGTIESTMIPVSFVAWFNPAVSILDIPYLYPTDRAKSQQLRSSAFGKAVLESFSSRQLLGITLWPNGRKSLTSNKQLDKLDALPGQKFRVMDSLLKLGSIAIIQTVIDRYKYNPPSGERFDMFDDIEHMFLFTDKAMRELARRADLEVLNLEERLWLAGEVCIFRKPQ